MNITYTQNGDYLIPNIVIRKTKPLGHYGRLRKAYLEMHRPILFNELVLSDRLFEHCAEIDEAARSRMELIVRSLAEQNGVTEQLKAENQMEWVRQMNACKAQAEKIVKGNNIAYLYYLQRLNEQADSIYQITEKLAILEKDSILWADALSQRGLTNIRTVSYTHLDVYKRQSQCSPPRLRITG